MKNFEDKIRENIAQGNLLSKSLFAGYGGLLLESKGIEIIQMIVMILVVAFFIGLGIYGNYKDKK